MECKRCEKRGKTWTGADPICGFSERGKFDHGNWNCATLNELRDRVEPTAHSSEDQYLGVIGNGGVFIVLTWYKWCGRTENAVVVDGDAVRPLTLRDAEFFLGDEDPLYWEEMYS